jgi:opacity protein-like surface antigen
MAIKFGKVNLLGGCLVVSSILTPALATGFYIGAGGGYNIGSSSITSDLSQVVGKGANKRNDLAIKGFQGSLYTGWGLPFYSNKFYSGVEISADLSATKGTETHPFGVDIANHVQNSNLSLKHRYGASIFMKNGVFIGNKKLLYMKIGVTSASWSINSTTDFVNNNSRIVSQSKNKTSHLMGIKGAIGVQIGLTQDIDIGLEWDYSVYERLKLTQHSAAGLNQAISHKVNPRLGSILITISKIF